MDWLDLTPHWAVADTRRCLVLASALISMSAVALVLRWRANNERQRAGARDFGARTIGWWIVVSVFMPAVFAGGFIVLAVFSIASLVTWFEFCRLVRPTALRGRDLGWALPVVVVFAATIAGRVPAPWWVVVLGSVAVIAISAATVGSASGNLRARWRALGYVVCVVLLGAAPALGLRYGSDWLAFVIVVVQSGDILQYIFGRTLGRTPLAPWLSPKKTWEGLLGGVLGGACLGAALSGMIAARPLAGFGWGLAITVAGTASGLTMSAAKRQHGAKDFGASLPGHGGLMDRLDSLWGAAAAVYLCLAW